MKYLITIATVLCFLLQSCSNNTPKYQGVTPKTVGSNRCGIKDNQKTYRVAHYDRGPVNGAKDDDGDGVISPQEAFSHWDFEQLLRVLETGLEWQTYAWTNIDTCYAFTIIAGDFYEDKSQGLLWTTCRSFAFIVRDNKGNLLGGSDKNAACRNFGSHQWIVL